MMFAVFKYHLVVFNLSLNWKVFLQYYLWFFQRCGSIATRLKCIRHYNEVSHCNYASIMHRNVMTGTRSATHIQRYMANEQICWQNDARKTANLVRTLAIIKTFSLRGRVWECRLHKISWVWSHRAAMYMSSGGSLCPARVPQPRSFGLWVYLGINRQRKAVWGSSAILVHSPKVTTNRRGNTALLMRTIFQSTKHCHSVL